jgi:NADPH2 dehydrogenase
MRMENPIPQFAYIVEKLAQQYPNLAYLHVVEPRVMNNLDIEAPRGESNDFIRNLWLGPIISAGGYHLSLAIEMTNKYPNELIAFSRYFISNVSSLA